MKKHSVALLLCTLCLLFTVGIWGGVELGSYLKQRYQAGREKINTTVAVVNQDAGAQLGGKLVNYADSVIESLGSDYSLISASAAQKGYESGIYGAIVTFPADFSANIVSINEKTPRQATIQFTINPKLPEDRYIPLYIQLLEMQQHVNNTIAYAYVLTVYEQLHSAQDEIDVFLSNDEVDMAAVKKVSLGNYTEHLQLGDMPRSPFDPDRTDLQPFVADAESIAADINKVYVESYKAAQEDFDKVETAISEYGTELVDKGESWADEMEQWVGDMTVYSKEAKHYQEKIEDWNSAANTYLEEEESYRQNVEQYIQNANTDLEEQVQKLNAYYDELSAWRGSAESALQGVVSGADEISGAVARVEVVAGELSADIDTYNAQVESLNAWIDFLQDCQAAWGDPEAVLPEWPEAELPVSLPGIYNETPDLMASMDEGLSTLRTSGETTLGELSADTPEVMALTPLEAVPPTLPEAPDALGELKPKDIPETPPEIEEALTELTKAYAQYKPEDYLNEKTAEDAERNVDRFASILSSAEGNLQASEASNLAKLNSIYIDYNTHIVDLRQKIYENYNTEHNNLSGSLAELSSTLAGTSAENHALLDSFVSRMPNSRQASTVNLKIVEETVTPVSYSLNYIRNVEEFDVSGVAEQLGLIMGVLLLAVLVELILLLRQRQRAKKREE